MAQREVESPSTIARRAKKNQQLSPKRSADGERTETPPGSAKEKGRLVRATSDFGNDRVVPAAKPKLSRSLSTGGQETTLAPSRSNPAPLFIEPIKQSPKDERASNAPLPSSASSSPPGSPLTTSNQSASNSELRKSSTIKRLSHVRASRPSRHSGSQAISLGCVLALWLRQEQAFEGGRFSPRYPPLTIARLRPLCRKPRGASCDSCRPPACSARTRLMTCASSYSS